MGAMDPNVDLGKYRQLDTDATNGEGELIPEKQTLNSRYVSDFLSSRGITAENFDKNFTLATAIDLTGNQQAKGSAEMNGILRKTKAYLDSKAKSTGDADWSNLLEDMNESAAKSTIHRKLVEVNDTGSEADMQLAYNTYRTTKMYCNRMFKIQEQFNKTREKEKTEVGTSFKDDLSGVMTDVKKNWNHLEGKEKMLLVVGGLIGAAMLMSSDSPRMEKVKETVFTCFKIAGVAWLGNTVIKVFTGKSGLDTLSDWSKSNVANADFWKKAFHTESEKAEILQKGTIFLSDMDFMRLAGEYKKAKDLGKNEIDLPTVDPRDMDSKQIFTALDVFFKKDPNYDVSKLMQKYAQAKPPKPTFQQVVAAELIEDNSINMGDDLITRTGNAVKGAYTEAKNYVVPKVEGAVDYVQNGNFEKTLGKAGEKGGRFIAGAGRGLGKFGKGAILGITAGAGGLIKPLYEGGKEVGREVIAGAGEVADDVKEAGVATFEWAKGLYKKSFGKPGTDEEVMDWYSNTMTGWVDSSSTDLEKTVRQKTQDPNKAQGYVDSIKGATERVNNDVNVHYVVKGNEIFVASDIQVPDIVNNKKGIIEAPRKAYDGAKEFLKKQYPAAADKIDVMMDLPYLGVHIKNENIYRVFVRMPLPDSTEYNQRLSGRWVPNELQGVRDSIKFNEGTKLDVAKMKDWQKNLLKVRFYLDSTQTNELAAVVDSYNKLYMDHGLSLDDAMKMIFETQTDATKNRDETIKTDLKLAPKLFANRGILDANESDIASIESKAASKINGSADDQKEFGVTIKKARGYSLRLAILGDKDAMLEWHYDPKKNSVEDLLKVYKAKVDNLAEDRNKGN